MRGMIVVGGSLAQRPRNGGHTWVLLQYLLGLRRLGLEVTFVDRLEPGMCVDERGRPCAPADSLNVRYYRRVMDLYDLEGAHCLLLGEEGAQATAEALCGLGRRELLARIREADMLLNVMGFVHDPEILDAARRRVFLDIDPGFGQMWRELGLADVFAGHDDFVTVGRNIGDPDCTVPDCGLPWIPTSPPVVLREWPAAPPCSGAFTSIATWRGPFAPIEYDGITYGLRAHEFRKFARLPTMSDPAFEIALDIDAGDDADLRLLTDNAWSVVNPLEAAGDPLAYRRYIRSSAAEFMVAKDMYVRSNSGWFSDRSACYLASGRPVIAQDTSLSRHYPTDGGLLTFSTVSEARDAVEKVARDGERHGRAARRVAEEYFDSDRVLGTMLRNLGMGVA